MISGSPCAPHRLGGLSKKCNIEKTHVLKHRVNANRGGKQASERYIPYTEIIQPFSQLRCVDNTQVATQCRF